MVGLWGTMDVILANGLVNPTAQSEITGMVTPRLFFSRVNTTLPGHASPKY